jgi:hypothetical protein
MSRAGILTACVVAIAATLGSSCTRAPNRRDGTIEAEAVTGTIAVSPGDYEALKERIMLNGVSRSCWKTDEKERVTITGSESNTAVFETGAVPGIADVRIKGSKRFVAKIISKAQSITGAKASLTRLKLIAETRTYRGFKHSHMVALEKELGVTMTSVDRSSSSVNEVVTIKCSFEEGLNGVRLKYAERDASLRITIEGDPVFVDGVKVLVNKTQQPVP